jgi:hypothetical protein
MEIAQEYASQTAYLADVVMRLPAWHAAHDEVRGHIGLASGEDTATVRSKFAAAAARFRAAGHPIDAARCDQMSTNPVADAGG